MICYNCHKEIDQNDNYCRFCGAGQGSYIAWYYKMWGVWILFFLIGPFCLWFLYKSPSKNKNAKIINAVLISLLSVIMCYKFYIMVKQMQELYSSVISGALF